MNGERRAREDTWGRLCNPARLAQPQRPTLRTSHFPDPPPTTLRQRNQPLDKHRGTQGHRPEHPLNSAPPGRRERAQQTAQDRPQRPCAGRTLQGAAIVQEPSALRPSLEPTLPKPDQISVAVDMDKADGMML